MELGRRRLRADERRSLDRAHERVQLAAEVQRVVRRACAPRASRAPRRSAVRRPASGRGRARASRSARGRVPPARRGRCACPPSSRRRSRRATVAAAPRSPRSCRSRPAPRCRGGSRESLPRRSRTCSHSRGCGGTRCRPDPPSRRAASPRATTRVPPPPPPASPRGSRGRAGTRRSAGPNASRSRAKAAASRYARRMIAAEPTAFSQREVLSTTPAAILKPSSSAPIGYASAPSNTISPVASARVPSLSLSLRIVKPFGRPSISRGTRKHADAARSLRSTLRARGDDELIGVRDRAEPLLAVQPPGPFAVTTHGPREVRAHVRAAVLLGEELRAALTAVVVRIQQWRQELLTQLVGAVEAERADQPRRAGDGARVAALARVGEQEEEARLLERLRRRGSPTPRLLARPPRTPGGSAHQSRPSSAPRAPARRRAGRPPARRQRRTPRAAPSRRTSARDRHPRRSPRGPHYR